MPRILDQSTSKPWWRRKDSSLTPQETRRLQETADALLAACNRADKLLAAATEVGLLDKLAAHIHPNEINGTCDDISESLRVSYASHS